MKEKQITVYECEFCGSVHENEDWMKMHEELCPLNPKNQPCATCSMQILGIGCAHKMDMEKITGNVKCFFYKQGVPVNLNNIFSGINENIDKEPPE